MDDHRLAAQLAATAGRLLIALRDDGLTQGKALGALGDVVAHEYLVRTLAVQRPEDGLLSEEGAADPARLQKARVWIVDPLDGTREFSEGRDDWAVHVALCIGGEATIGAVALPALGLTFDTGAPPVLPAAPAGPPRIVVSRSRPPEAATRVAAAIGGALVPLGSAGAKAMAVVRGEAEAYVHAGGQFEWDSAAPVAVAAAAGLHVSRLDGSALVYNRPDPYLPDLVICRPELKSAVLAALG
jgi:3'(2'), 5'-bisphosphate nucleotidase